jgi:hypothetical protein
MKELAESPFLTDNAENSTQITENPPKKIRTKLSPPATWLSFSRGMIVIFLCE